MIAFLKEGGAHTQRELRSVNMQIAWRPGIGKKKLSYFHSASKQHLSSHELSFKASFKAMPYCWRACMKYNLTKLD